MILETIAFVLLLARLASVGFCIKVVSKQLHLLKRSTNTDGLSELRLVMFLMGSALLLTNVLPIMVDTYYAFIDTDAGWNPLLVAYASNNAIGWLIGSMLLYKIYMIASGEDNQDSV